MKKVYALGFFDGVHLGHQALIAQCVQLAKELDAVPGAVTFDIHPQSLVSGQIPPMLNTVSERMRLLRFYGIRQVHTLQFDRETMQMPWRDFFRYLVEELDAGALVCGDDFRFGSKGEGNAQLLAAACEQAGIACAVVPEQTVDSIRVSSTHIRSLIEQGQMEQAVKFLGHPHVLSGPVVSGRKLGRTIGVPTANLELPEGLVVPRLGVYACKTVVDGREFPAVTNVGMRPTVNGHHITVEPWILDFDGDLYGRTIPLYFYKYLRPEVKFASLEELQAQILKDAEKTRDFLKISLYNRENL